ncbi:MAG: alpha/beta fold hydrolase [Chloroflexota bacterium]
MRIEANGISINYEIHGQGPNLVLIHGAGDNLNMWYRQVPVFSERYRVITYDVRGSGETESPEGEYSMPLLARDAYELMKALGVKDAYFLGYSMGGHIALELALNHPELVKALILASSSPPLTPPTPEVLKRRQAMSELLDKGDMEALAEKMTTDAFSPGFQSGNPVEFERYMKVKLQNNPGGIAKIMRRVPESPPDLSKLKCPVLILIGENDRVMGLEQGKKAQEAIPDSKLIVLPAGHAVPIELPDRFNRTVMDFLSESA